MDVSLIFRLQSGAKFPRAAIGSKGEKAGGVWLTNRTAHRTVRLDRFGRTRVPFPLGGAQRSFAINSGPFGKAVR